MLVVLSYTVVPLMALHHAERTTRDQYFPLVGGEAAVREATPAFAALNATANLTVTVGNNTHGYINKTRAALYAFFTTHFTGRKVDGEMQPDAIYAFDQVRVTTTGSVIDVW
jgi:hypothetical protein